MNQFRVNPDWPLYVVESFYPHNVRPAWFPLERVRPTTEVEKAEARLAEVKEKHPGGSYRIREYLPASVHKAATRSPVCTAKVST